ncbi:hypothetical protein CPB83DRAFT_855477 [Crepidotus variabilis]|uniref:F-box domain-containing protein n=1 Tax=Crepidotus variabilis TaxID=179855 RepID=A0A9P6JPL8_9AGAR|nr:hypothetical protein CPB83DRAFT_855477 [Crepidotus variabilis]
MDSLPKELLLHIFSQSQREFVDCRDISVVLSHVCAKWRAIIIGAGTLWRNISITLPLSRSTKFRIDVYLLRSSHFPLDIIFDVRDPEWDWKEETHQAGWDAVAPIIQTLTNHSKRWRSVEILADNWLPIFAFLSYNKANNSARQLETLSLARCNVYMASQGQTFQPVGLREPLPLLGGLRSGLVSLTNLSLIGVHVDWIQCAFPSLIRLEFKYQSSDVMPTFHQFTGLLKTCTALRELIIAGWGPILPEDHAHYPEFITLINLTHFSFGFVDVTYGCQFLPTLRLPQLQSLVIEDLNPILDPLNTSDATAVLSTFTKLSASINTSSTPCIPLSRVSQLELRSIRAGKATFLNFYRHMPDLERLHLNHTAEEALSSLENLAASLGSGKDFFRLAQLTCTDISPEVLTKLLEGKRLDNVLCPTRTVAADFIRLNPFDLDSALRKRMIEVKIDVLVDSERL